MQRKMVELQKILKRDDVASFKYRFVVYVVDVAIRLEKCICSKAYS